MSALPCPALRGSGKIRKIPPGGNPGPFSAVMFYCCNSDRWISGKIKRTDIFFNLCWNLFENFVGGRYGYGVLKKLSYVGPISLGGMDLNFSAKFSNVRCFSAIGWKVFRKMLFAKWNLPMWKRGKVCLYVFFIVSFEMFILFCNVHLWWWQPFVGRKFLESIYLVVFAFCDLEWRNSKIKCKSILNLFL